jgi:hypothetical protein
LGGYGYGLFKDTSRHSLEATEKNWSIIVMYCTINYVTNLNVKTFVIYNPSKVTMGNNTTEWKYSYKGVVWRWSFINIISSTSGEKSPQYLWAAIDIDNAYPTYL